MSESPLRALIWCAVSTKVQADEDKVSLPEQEKTALAFCREQGFVVTDILRVPGHSRYYIDIHECAADMVKRGISAFDRLLSYWHECAFDVLIVRDGERFARTQALHAYVVERTIASHARIYSFRDGWIDQRNFRIFAAMGGYIAAGSIDRLVRGRELAMEDRAARGLPTSSTVVYSHQVLRDTNGKALRMVAHPDRRLVVEAAARYAVQRHAWQHIEVLLDLDGFSKEGKPFRLGYFYRMFHNPNFWGHGFRNRFQSDGSPVDGFANTWVFDPSEPPPKGVKVWRDTHEPALTGDLAEELKSELRRRIDLIQGKARPETTHPLSGLLICADCGYSLVYRYNKGYPGYGCQSRFFRHDGRDCDSTKQISLNKLRQFIDERLRRMVASQDINVLVPDAAASEDLRRAIADAEAACVRLTNRASQLILDKADAPESLREIYDAQIVALATERDTAKAMLERLKGEYARFDINSEAQRAYAIIERSVDAFWEMEEAEQNQLLRTLMGNRRYVVKDGEIIGTALTRKAKREKRKG